MYTRLPIMFSLAIALVLLICTGEIEANTYTLDVTQDVTLQGTSNLNSLPYLIVGTHPGDPLKRSLLQFEDLPSDPPNSCSHIRWAKMYVYYLEASSSSGNQVPFISRPLQVYQVKRSWSESQATSTLRSTTGGNSQSWSAAYLALDGSDAHSQGILSSPVTISAARPAGFIVFDVTEAMRNWKSGNPNHGLLLLATNENTLGRDIRFASNAHSDGNKHAFIEVLCD